MQLQASTETRYLIFLALFSGTRIPPGRVSGRNTSHTRAASRPNPADSHKPPRYPSRSVNNPDEKEAIAIARKYHICNCPLINPRLSSRLMSSVMAVVPIHIPDQAMPHRIRPASNSQGPWETAEKMVEIAPSASEPTINPRRGRRSYNQPAGPFERMRINRLAPSTTPTMLECDACLEHDVCFGQHGIESRVAEQA